MNQPSPSYTCACVNAGKPVNCSSCLRRLRVQERANRSAAHAKHEGAELNARHQVKL